jgi:hypothetical protein
MIAIRNSGISVTTLMGRGATYEAVINGLQKHRIAQLTLVGIILTRIPTTDLAVLSPDHTAELAEGAEFVEGLHLAAAMHYYGFRSMVRTM